MKILLKDTFIDRFANQLDFISLDSPKRAGKFKSDLFSRIKEIPANPYRYRKSIYFNDDNIRDLVYKGYIPLFSELMKILLKFSALLNFKTNQLISN